MWWLIPEEVQVSNALQLTLIYTIMVDVMCHPVGDDNTQYDAKHEVYTTSALHNQHHQGDVGPAVWQDTKQSTMPLGSSMCILVRSVLISWYSAASGIIAILGDASPEDASKHA